jgi:hypothetical protein
MYFCRYCVPFGLLKAQNLHKCRNLFSTVFPDPDPDAKGADCVCAIDVLPHHQPF